MYEQLKQRRVEYLRCALRKRASTTNTTQTPQIWQDTKNWWDKFTSPDAKSGDAMNAFGQIYQNNPFLATAATAVVPWLAGTVVDSVSGNNNNGKGGGGGIGVGGVLGLAGLGLGLYHAWPTLKEYYNGYNDSSELQKLLSSKTALTPEQRARAMQLQSRLGGYNKFRDSFLVSKNNRALLDISRANPNLMLDLHSAQFAQKDQLNQFAANWFGGDRAVADINLQMMQNLATQGKISKEQWERIQTAYNLYTDPGFFGLNHLARVKPDKNSAYKLTPGMSAWAEKNIPNYKAPTAASTAQQQQRQQTEAAGTTQTKEQAQQPVARPVGTPLYNQYSGQDVYNKVMGSASPKPARVQTPGINYGPRVPQAQTPKSTPNVPPQTKERQQ